MTILRAWLLVSAVGLGGVTLAASQGLDAVAPTPSAEAIAVAKELIATISGDVIVDLTGKMVAQIWPQLDQAMRTRYPTLDTATAVELRAAFEKQMALNVAESLQNGPEVYARYLTVAEMRDIQAFYRTPTGAKTLKLMPQISAEIMGQFLPRLQPMMQRIDGALVAILNKHGYPAK